ncbi:hypothetical protein JHD46_00340 [Sulfurimonas sp. SAG-AH-194-C20]|nr:hypothetical protein [Sulfurimonas sp. SAG-AH-194-C20]MDF1878079.1 hypothetical protein [Sulfurimonas sp. SAG-AH-194-C20]
MQVAQYTFQSPSTSQVQVGRLDPSSVKEEKSASAPASDQTQAKAQSFVATQVQEVKPTVNSNSIDVYA